MSDFSTVDQVIGAAEAVNAESVGGTGNGAIAGFEYRPFRTDQNPRHTTGLGWFGPDVQDVEMKVQACDLGAIVTVELVCRPGLMDPLAVEYAIVYD